MKSFSKLESFKTTSGLGDSSYSYFRKGKLHTVRRVYIQKNSYDPEGNLISQKILKEGPTSTFLSSPKSQENSAFKAYSVKGREATFGSEQIFSPSILTRHEPSQQTIEGSRSEDYAASCNNFFNHVQIYRLSPLPQEHKRGRFEHQDWGRMEREENYPTRYGCIVDCRGLQHFDPGPTLASESERIQGDSRGYPKNSRLPRFRNSL